MGIPSSGQLSTDEVGGAQRVALVLMDGVSGLPWPPVVVADEDRALAWAGLFARARRAGLEVDVLCGLTSDGTRGLVGYLSWALEWVNHQRCIFHRWRLVSGELARQASLAPAGQVGEAARQQVRRELVGLLRRVVEAASVGGRGLCRDGWPRIPKVGGWRGCWPSI